MADEDNIVDIGLRFQLNRQSATEARKALEKELSKLTLNIDRPELIASGRKFTTGAGTAKSTDREVAAQEALIATASKRLAEIRDKLAADAQKNARAETNATNKLAGAVRNQALKTLAARDALLQEQSSLTAAISFADRIIQEAAEAYSIELQTGVNLLRARNAAAKINARRGEGANEGELSGRGAGSRQPGKGQLSQDDAARESTREDFLIARNRQEFAAATARSAEIQRKFNEAIKDQNEIFVSEQAKIAADKKAQNKKDLQSQIRITKKSEELDSIRAQRVKDAELIAKEELGLFRQSKAAFERSLRALAKEGQAQTKAAQEATAATNAELIQRQKLADRLKEINRRADAQFQKNFGSESNAINANIGGNFRGGGGGGKRPATPSPDGPNRYRKAIDDLFSSLRRTDVAAFEFGETVRGTATRLLAWGVTAKIVFDTVGKFRQAVDEVIELDKQVRRLVFFQTAGGPGGVEAFNKSFGDTTTRTKQLGEAFRAITDEAQRTGLSIREVVAAANTVARIGGNPFEKIGNSLRPTDFLLATEGLTQLEGGLLSADRAAELLQATTAQFGLQIKDGTRDLTNFTVVAARLAAVANATSFGVEELGSVVARFGSAALNVQRLSFDQSLELAGVAAKVLGTNASRTATALRQLTTRIAERADDIEALTGIEIKTENGQLVGYPALVNALKAIDSLKGSALQIQLAKDIGDAETISDVLALAGAYEQVQEAILSLEDADVAAKRASDQVEAFLKQAATQSDSAASSINKLNASFVQLAQSSGVDALIATIVNTFREGVNQTTDFVDAVYKSDKALSLLSGTIVALGGILGKKLIVTLGGSLGFLANNLSKEIQNSLSGAISPEQFQGSTQKLFEAGKISAEKQLAFNQKNSLIVNSIKATEIEIGRQAASLNALRATGLATVTQIEGHEKSLEAITARRIQLLKQEESLRNKVVASAAKATGAATIINNAGTIIGVATALGGSFVAELFSSGFTDSKVQSEVKEGLSSIFNATSIGATIGSIIPGLGTGLGAALGAVLGAGFSLFAESDFEKQAKKQIALNEEIAKKRQQAEISTRRQISIRAAEEFAIASRQAKASENLVIIDNEIEAIQTQIAEGGLRALHQKALEEKLGQKFLIRKRLEKEVSLEEEKSLQRRLALEEKLVDIKSIGNIVGQSLDIKKQIEQQINDLSTGGAINKGKAILIDFDIDREKIRSEIETLAATGKQIDIRIRELAGSNSKEDRDEYRRLVRTREEVVNSIVSKELEVVSKQVTAATQILNNTREAAKTIIKSYEDASKKLQDSFEKVEQISVRISENILKSIEQVNQGDKGILELQNARSARRKDIPSTTNQDEFTKALRESLGELGNARQIERGRFSGRSAAQDFVESITSKRVTGKFIPGGLTEPGVPGGTVAVRPGQNQRTERDVTVQVTTNLFRELAKATIEARDANNLEAQAKVISIQKQIDAEQQAFDQNAKFLNQEQSILDTRIKVTNELIASEKAAIEIIRERAAQEAKLGASALDDPQKFIEDVRKSINAQNFFKSLGLGGGKLNEALRPFDTNRDNQINDNERDRALPTIVRIFSDAVQKLGKNNFTALQTVREQLQGADRIGARVGGFQPSEVIQLLERALFQSTDALVNSVTDEQKRGVNIETSLAEQVSAYAALNKITQERIKDESALRDIELARQKILKEEVTSIESQQLPAALAAVKTESANLKTELENLKIKVAEISKFADGLGNSFTNLNTVLADIAKASKAAAGLEPSIIGKERALTEPKPVGISVESITKMADSINEAMARGATSIADAFKAISIDATFAPLEVALTANVKNIIEGEEFVKELAAVLKVDGVESQINDIRAVLSKLLKLELSRSGNDLGITGDE